MIQSDWITIDNTGFSERELCRLLNFLIFGLRHSEEERVGVNIELRWERENKRVISWAAGNSTDTSSPSVNTVYCSLFCLLSIGGRIFKRRC